jgi:hypothetical protein
MRHDPEELFELQQPAPEGAPLLHHLEGFIDAGAAGRLLAEHLLRDYEHQTVATFDVDRLIDYRSRRPTMVYDNGRWTSYDTPELGVHLLHDTVGKPFLLLTGPEPDHEWDLFARAVGILADKLKAGPAVGFLGIPAGVPHTRPLGVIAHGTRDGLAVGTQRLPDKIELPGSASALIELRFGEAGRDAFGFAVQVPHYLAQAMYPAAALTLLESVREAGELDLPGVDLQVAAERTNEAIQQQISESGEVAELVQALEQQFDAAAAEEQEGLLAEGEAMPTADELAAQFERFLADQQKPPDQP